jgi:cytochrome b561
MAGLTHLALYALLLALPVLGWAMSSASGTPVHFFGLTLPPILGEDDDLADTLQVWHVNAAWALLVLATVHVAAALWHHFVRRDRTLRMMLPRRRR